MLLAILTFFPVLYLAGNQDLDLNNLDQRAAYSKGIGSFKAAGADQAVLNLVQRDLQVAAVDAGNLYQAELMARGLSVAIRVPVQDAPPV